MKIIKILSAIAVLLCIPAMAQTSLMPGGVSLDNRQAKTVTHSSMEALNAVLPGDFFAYDIVDGSEVFGTMPLAGPYTISSIGPIDNSMYIPQADDFTQDGMLYALDFRSGKRLLMVDPTTAAVTVMGTLSGRDPSEIYPTGLTWDPVDQQMYALCSSGSQTTLYTLDLGTATLTPIGQTGTPAGSWIEADEDGTIYMGDLLDQNLYTLDKNTGAATLVGSFGVPANTGELDATIDPETGKLYMTTWNGTTGNPATYQSYLYEIDKTTGAGTQIGDLMGASVVMLSIAPTTECAKPYNVTVGELTPNQVTVLSGDDTLYYDLITTALPGTVDLNNDPLTFDDVQSPFTAPIYLAPNYTYEFYVRQDCSRNNSDVSEWVGPFHFTTQTLASCPEPTGVMTTSVTDNGATVVADDTSAEYDVRSTGTPENLDITMLNEISTPDIENVMSPHTVSGLPSNRTFEYYVRTDCGAVDNNLNVSKWVGPYTFTTTAPCVAPAAADIDISTTSNSAVITDLAGQAGDMYDLITTANPGTINVDGMGQPTDPVTHSGVTSPYTASNLATNWTYEFYVRKSCGTEWVGPFQFTTNPSATPLRMGISPNPTTGIVKVKGADTIEVFDLSGTSRLSLSVEDETIDLSTLEKGQYVIHMTDNEGNTTIEHLIKN